MPCGSRQAAAQGRFCKQVEMLAVEKWGGQEKLDAERAKRHKKRLEREKEKAGKSES